MIKNINPKITTIALGAALLLSASPITAFAENTDVNVPSLGTRSQDVTATFTIDDDILIDLGYGAIATIPINVPLSYNSSNKTFEGGRTVYCSGVIPENKKVTVNIDTISTDLGKIVDNHDNEYNVSSADGFAVNLSRTDWNQSEMALNLSRVEAGNLENLITSNLSVTIPGRGFVPRVTGSFESTIPLIIKQETV